MIPADAKTKSIQVPWITLGLILVSLLGSLLVALDPDSAPEFAFNPMSPTFATALASLFLHANVLHLLGNMVFLAAVGPKVEAVAGKIAYLCIYFVGGLAGVAAHWAVMRSIGAPTPLLGASGAIASCAGYCSVRFIGRRVPLAPNLTVTVGAVTLIWVFLQALGAFVRFGNYQGGTAYWTHLAGFFTGLLLSLLFRAPKQARVQFGHELLDKMGERGPGALLQASEKHLEQHPDDPRALRDKAAALHQMGDLTQEADVLARLLDFVPEGAQKQVLIDLGECGGLNLVSPIRRLRWAESFKDENPVLAQQLLRSLISDQSATVQRPDALLALAELVEEPDKAPLLHELEHNYAFHAATEAARSKGLIH